MRYSSFALVIPTIMLFLLIGCSGGTSPSTPDLTTNSDSHTAAVDTALNGVEIQNTSLSEVRLNGVNLLPWGFRDLVLDPEGTYPIEIELEDRAGEVVVEVEGAVLMANSEPVESYSGTSDVSLTVSDLNERITVHIEVTGEYPQVRDITIRTVQTDNLPIPPLAGTVSYQVPELGIPVDIAENELLIGVTVGTDITVVETLVGALGCELLRAIPNIDAYRLRIPDGASYEHYMNLFRSSAIVKYAELNALAYPCIIPNDTFEDDEYGNGLMQLYDAWDIHTGTDATIVAVIDSGTMRDHPDLYENVIDGEDFINPIGDGLGGETPGDGVDNNNDGVTDGNVGHGTHCSGIIGAVGNNSEGVSGHTWATKILPCRVFPVDGDSGAMDSSVAEAMMYASDQGAVAESLSLGSYYPSSTQQAAINYAWNNGTVVVAAAGNGSTSQNHYPSSFNNVMSVAATNSSDHKAGFSNYGAAVDVSAPGVQIASSYFYEHGGDPWSVPENQRYVLMNGTSMACPQASGLVGLVASYFPSYNQAELFDQVKYTTDNIDAINPGYEGDLGTGRLNAYKALTTPLEPEFEVVALWSDDDHPLFSQGNRDGFMNPGEIIEFMPSIKNIGLRGAQDCTVSLIETDGYIEPFISVASLGYLERGETDTPQDPLIFRVRSDVVDNQVVDLTLHFEYNNGDPIDLPYSVTIRKDNGVIDTIACYGESMLDDEVRKGATNIPALSFTIEGDLNYGILEELIVTQSGTVDNADLGQVTLWLDSNEDGMFSTFFDTRIAYQSYEHQGYRGSFDDLNDPAAGFGTGVDYEQNPDVYFDEFGTAHFFDCVLPTAPGVPRTVFIVFDVLPTAETGSTVQIGVKEAAHVRVRIPDQVNPIDFPIETPETPIVGTWLDPAKMTVSGPGTEALYSWRPECAVCPVTGNIYVVFDSNRNGNFDALFKRSVDQGVSFEGAKVLDSSNANEFYPDLQVDSTGVIHVVYYSTKISGQNREIYYTRSFDNGENFDTPVRLTNAVRDSRIPKLAVGPDDSLNLAWNDNRTGTNDYNIYFKRSEDGGDSWTDDLMVADTYYASEEVAIIVGGDGVIHITWEEFSNYYSANVFYSRSVDDGLNFTAPFKISSGTYNNRGWHSDVGADDLGHVYVVFHYVPWNSDAELAARISDDSGENWDSVFVMTSNSVPDSRPAIHVMPDGSYIDIVFRSRAADTWNIYHTFSEDGLDSWEERVQISISTGGDAREPVVVRAGNLNIYAFWEDIVNAYGSYEVFYNRFIY